LSTKGYSRYYTFNDNAINDCIDVMWIAYETYGDQKYLERAKRGGDFIILSQLPEPQAGWAQQYDWDMKPAWARKFEPPGPNGACTARNIRTLVQLYLNTGEEKYLKPIPAAIDWLNRSRIGENLWARFYELGTNKPLYMNKKYELVYTDDDLPTHYSFKSSYGVPSAIAFYEKVKKMGRDAYIAERDRELTAEQKRERARRMEPDVRKIIVALDEDGRWITGSRIRCSTFNRNLQTLAQYVELVGA
ncbi:MAG: pectate lyase, partial [Armatimonadota bacterium]